MKAWGACAGALAWCCFVACGTTTPAGSAGQHDAALDDGGEAAGAGGEAGSGSCEYELHDPCLADCVATDVRHDMECEHGVWSCPAGTTPLASCPAGTCRTTYSACCPPGANQAVPMKCGNDGGGLGCAPRSTFANNPGDACANPNYCDVATFGELANRACPALDAQCVFHDECQFICYCYATGDGGLVWGCEGSLCPTP